ncbi:MAG: ABC transporter substrate-binding protein [Gemmataceae bacterium]
MLLSFRVGAIATLLVSLLAVGLLTAQKPRKEEEEDPPSKTPPTTKKPKREEEEDKPPPSKVLDVEDDPKTVPPPSRPRVVDLATAAREATRPAVKGLYSDLAVPIDILMARLEFGAGPGGVKKPASKLYVAPIGVYVGPTSPLRKELRVRNVRRDGRVDDEEQVLTSSQIVEVEYYEQIGIRTVRAFLDNLKTVVVPDFPRLEQLQAAELALSALMRWHYAARETGVRPGEQWQDLEQAMREALADVLLEEIDLLAEAKSWEAAFALIRRLVDYAPRPPSAAYTRVTQGITALLKGALADSNFTQDRLDELREKLASIEEQFPGTTSPLSQTLKDTAGALLARAKSLAAQKKNSEALDLLRQAEKTWPDYPGLRAYRATLDRGYAVLRIGLAELPTRFSPALATTDSERRCLDLLFESLVTLVPDEEGRLYYEPTLATGRPRVLPLGRQFHLPVGARWSDHSESQARPITASDLRATVSWMKEGRYAGPLSVWGDLLERVQVGGNAQRVELTLSQGFLDPLAAMAFKVQPAHHKLGSEEFARKPVGSGPYVLQGEKTDSTLGRKYIAFAENPYYASRPGKAGLPRVREVRLYVPPDPVKDLLDGSLDMVFDLTAEQAGKLQTAPGVVVPPPNKQPQDRRVYFLAVNNRKLILADLRLALARAIDREALLDEYFRKGYPEKIHYALNGPFPVGSWANDPNLVSRRDPKSQDPFDLDLARAKFKAVLAKTGKSEVALTLKYPTGNKAVEEAMKALCNQVSRDVPGLRLSAEGVNPYLLREEVEERGNYDLAYYHYDFPEGAFWLWPLLGHGDRKGENYLGYTGPLLAQVQKASALRYFPEVQATARAIHARMLDSEMPFIPLWQLSPLYAYRRGGLDLPPLDPRTPFSRVALWRTTRG